MSLIKYFGYYSMRYRIHCILYINDKGTYETTFPWKNYTTRIQRRYSYLTIRLHNAGGRSILPCTVRNTSQKVVGK